LLQDPSFTRAVANVTGDPLLLAQIQKIIIARSLLGKEPSSS
jgi:hypothetical protein